MPSGLYIAVRPEDIFLSGISQSPGPPEIINLLLSVIYCNLSQAGMQRLFWGEKYLSGLYADGTFREVFVSEQDMPPDRPKL